MIGGKPVTVQMAGGNKLTLMPSQQGLGKIVRLPTSSTAANEQPKLVVVSRPKQPTATIASTSFDGPATTDVALAALAAEAGLIDPKSMIKQEMSGISGDVDDAVAHSLIKLEGGGAGDDDTMLMEQSSSQMDDTNNAGTTTTTVYFDGVNITNQSLGLKGGGPIKQLFRYNKLGLRGGSKDSVVEATAIDSNNDDTTTISDPVTESTTAADSEDTLAADDTTAAASAATAETDDSKNEELINEPLNSGDGDGDTITDSIEDDSNKEELNTDVPIENTAETTPVVDPVPPVVVDDVATAAVAAALPPSPPLEDDDVADAADISGADDINMDISITESDSGFSSVQQNDANNVSRQLSSNISDIPSSQNSVLSTNSSEMSIVPQPASSDDVIAGGLIAISSPSPTIAIPSPTIAIPSSPAPVITTTTIPPSVVAQPTAAATVAATTLLATMMTTSAATTATTTKTIQQIPTLITNNNNNKDSDALSALASAALDHSTKDTNIIVKKTELNSNIAESSPPPAAAILPKELWHTVGFVKGNSCDVLNYFMLSDLNNLNVDNLPELTGLSKINLEPGTAYKFRVAAINSVGIGQWSEVYIYIIFSVYLFIYFLIKNFRFQRLKRVYQVFRVLHLQLKLQNLVMVLICRGNHQIRIKAIY